MPLPQDLLHRSSEEAARRIALSFLDEAHAASLRLEDDSDAEALHDFRVAIRRLRSTLGAWRGELSGSIKKRHRRALMKLQNATGGGRDAEVAVLWLEAQREATSEEDLSALDWMIDRLRSRYAGAMDHVCADVRAAFGNIEDDLRRALETMRVELNLSASRAAPSYASTLATKVGEHVSELLEHLGRVRSLADEEEAHQSRIRGKRLRYLVEPVRDGLPQASAIVKRCKKLQDVLGDLNDTNVQTADLEQARADAPADLSDGLDAIARKIAERRRDLFGDLERNWLETDAGELSDACADLAGTLLRIAKPPVEIERKYLLRAMPELPKGHGGPKRIDQGWLPGDRLRERLRRIRAADGASRYVRTVKLGQGLQRVELEDETTESLFEALWPLTEGCRVQKRRTKVPDGDLVWEIDEFLDRELHLAEVEFDDPDREIELPAWLAPYVVRDVTGRSEYVNLNLAR